MFALENVTKKYGDKLVLDSMSFEFPDSGFVAISGRSGIGKTTMLNIIMGLEKADSGRVKWQGDARPAISCVFQEDRLLERESALENVLYVLRDRGEADAARAREILTELGLGGELDTRARDLSGGMARRVAIARALAYQADVYIMDEPIKGLDAETRQQTLDTIKKWTAGRLLIMVSHNPEDAAGADVLLEM
ncbi:MAG: ABC transporter ATP-binding protein [Lachnospiraceae bacterium]|nr:ABC transporter ATP-binding protein [Lachnospiraceae bacterium]